MRFRRKGPEASVEGRSDVAEGPEASVETEAVAVAEEAPIVAGPYDIDDVDDELERADLGGLLIPPVDGCDVRIQIDESTQQVQSVLIAGEDGAVEVKAFAAPRNGDLWGEVRPQIAADMAQRGGTATEREGRFGTEIMCVMPVQTPDGQSATQPSRVVGVNGPRWLLRATFLGRPAVEPDTAPEWEDALAQVVVRRGTEAMPVGAELPLHLPDGARRAT